MNSEKKRIILGIETSCDETSAALFVPGKGIIAQTLFSQIETHKPFGGVLPEVASRGQLERIKGIVEECIRAASLSIDDITTVAVTHKPGLPGSLLVGVCFAKAFAWASGKELIGIDHLEGHAFSAFIEHSIPFPHLCITASGGHTSMYYIQGFGNYQTIASTIDDAAGEAFDKISKVLGLGYPGGPIIEKYARDNNFADVFSYPRPCKDTMTFSFSGLKTAILYDLVKRGAYDLATRTLLDHSEQLKRDVASSLLVCIGDIFEHKVKLAYSQYPEAQALSFVGGVACNKYLKERLKTWCDRRKLKFFTPSPRYCTDNASMIAFVGNYKAEQGLFSSFDLDILR